MEKPERGVKAVKNKSPRHYKRVTWLLLALNSLVIVLVVLLCIWQSLIDYGRRKDSAEKSFMSAAESFCLFASGDMVNQQAAVFSWARYIEHDNMDLMEALSYLSNVAASTNIHLQLILADNLRGYSANSQQQGEERPSPLSGGHPVLFGTPVYPKIDYQQEASAFALVLPALTATQKERSDLLLTAPFSNPESGKSSLAFCAPVLIRNEEVGKDLYIIMKVIEKEELGATWRVSDSYRHASIVLLDRYGDYILRNKYFTGDNFWDFIKKNNDVSYFGIGIMQAEFQRPGASLLELKDAAGRSCYYVGSSMGKTGDKTFVACIRREEVLTGSVNFRLAMTVLVGMLVLFITDGYYLLSINRKLKESVERAEQESRFKTDFLSSMSHDIRTPMNAIMGLTKIMRRNLENKDRVRESLDKIELSGRHLLMLINDVLDISKIESEGVILSPAPFSLQAIIEEIKTLTETQCREKSLTISFKMNSITHDMFVADELRIKQVFMNLLSNAIKYTPKGGQVTVEISEDVSPKTQEKLLSSVRRLSEEQKENFSGSNSEIRESFQADSYLIRYVVSDSGIGMSESFMKTMYQAFTREVDTRVNKTPGTGLGLAIVKQLVDLMGGTIDCQSQVGKGTTFTVELDLPVARIEKIEKAGDADSKDESSYEGKLILIAEDNDINWEIESELLSYQGIQSERAENGQVCVEKLMKAAPGTFTAILMDMQMPVMDGLEATRIIRSLDDDSRNSIPIIAVTANAFVDDVRNCLEAGMDAHVCKPINVESVMKALREACLRHR